MRGRRSGLTIDVQVIPFHNAWPLSTEQLGQTGSRITSPFLALVAPTRSKALGQGQTGWLCQGVATKLPTCFIVGECDETA